MPLLKVPSVIANVIFTGPTCACSVIRFFSLPGNCAYQRATFSSAVPPWSAPKWKNVTSAFCGPRAISSCALRIGDDGVTDRQPSGTPKVNASTCIVSARTRPGRATAINTKRATRVIAVLMIGAYHYSPESTYAFPISPAGARPAAQRHLPGSERRHPGGGLILARFQTVGTASDPGRRQAQTGRHFRARDPDQDHRAVDLHLGRENLAGHRFDSLDVARHP